MSLNVCFGTTSVNVNVVWWISSLSTVASRVKSVELASFLKLAVVHSKLRDEPIRYRALRRPMVPQDYHPVL
jgi:hypothetical protein